MNLHQAVPAVYNGYSVAPAVYSGYTVAAGSPLLRRGEKNSHAENGGNVGGWGSISSLPQAREVEAFSISSGGPRDQAPAEP